MPKLITDSPDPYARRFTFPKWNGSVTVLQEPRLFRFLPEFASWSKAKHAEVSAEYLATAVAGQRIYHAEVRRACETYGDHGPLISGIIHDHFPDPIKDDLRTLNRAYQDHVYKAHAHHRAAGKRSWWGLSDAELRTHKVGS
jgi:hypothetical protein